MTIHGGLSFDEWREVQQARRWVRNFNRSFPKMVLALARLSNRLTGYGLTAAEVSKALNEGEIK